MVDGVVGNQIEEAQWSAYARTSPTSTSADATIATATVGDEPSEVPDICEELARTLVEDVPMPLDQESIPLTAASAATTATATGVVVDQTSGRLAATVMDVDESVRILIEDVPMLPVQVGISPNSAAAATSSTSSEAHLATVGGVD